MAALPEQARELIDGKNFATIATIEPDGGPQTRTSDGWHAPHRRARIP
jgi:Pyridoxamine 5'-phosphate oxidase